MSKTVPSQWKYLSIALMGVIATGVLAPSAFAANPTLEEVLATVLGIKAKTDNLPADPASSSAMLEFRYMEIQDTTSQIVEGYRLQCDQEYVVDSVRIFTNPPSSAGDDWQAPIFAANGFIPVTGAIDPAPGQQINQNIPINIGTPSQAGVTMVRTSSDGADDFTKVGFFITVPHSATCSLINTT